ncbi:MAG: FapA family protein [Pseudomonadota bacterium]
MAEQRDAKFRFSMSEDGMKLGVSRYSPPQGGGEGPSVKLLKRQVSQAGVRLPIDEEAAKRVVDSIQRDEEVRRIVLVRGIEAQEPRNASLVALGNLDFPVFPGDRFARKHPPLNACDGETIDGRVLRPKEHFEPKDIKVTMGENVELDSLTNAYVSTVWGMARLSEGTLGVEPLTHITEDATAVKATLHHMDFRGQPITAERVEKELRELGVVIDIDLGRLNTLLSKAREQGQPVPDQVVVAGRLPSPGRDGWLELLVSTRELAGTEDEAGRLDFRDRGTHPMVEAEQVVARLHPPSAGDGGIDIYGKTIPSSRGKAMVVRRGENIDVLDDEITFISRAKGVLSLEDNVLSVTECLLINDNVDLGTGNITLEYGSVKILGSIHAGFSVSAPKHIIVAGSIESATVSAGGNVEVSGGILMPDGGTVRAGGSVSCAYATNARIRAGGDVIIINDITNSDIRAEGRLLGTRGKGHVQGGKIITGKGMELKELGSELGVTTVVGIQIHHDDDHALRAERKRLKEAIRKIDDALGNDPPKTILTRTRPEKRAAVAEVIKHRVTLVRRRKAVAEEINQRMLARQEELAGVRIRVQRLIHPGVVVIIGSKKLAISKRTESATISWDARTGDIITG